MYRYNLYRFRFIQPDCVNDLLTDIFFFFGGFGIILSFFTGVLLTGAGVVEELSSSGHPVSRRRLKEWRPGLNLRVVNLLLQLLLGDLCLRVKEDQLPLPFPAPDRHLWRRPFLDMGEMSEIS